MAYIDQSEASIHRSRDLHQPKGRRIWILNSKNPSIDNIWFHLYSICRWFPNNKGMAMGIVVGGFGGGAFVFNQIQVWKEHNFLAGKKFWLMTLNTYSRLDFHLTLTSHGVKNDSFCKITIKSFSRLPSWTLTTCRRRGNSSPTWSYWTGCPA